jgi:hypothetical protein
MVIIIVMYRYRTSSRYIVMQAWTKNAGYQKKRKSCPRTECNESCLNLACFCMIHSFGKRTFDKFIKKPSRREEGRAGMSSHRPYSTRVREA